MIKWSEIESECGDYREGFVAVFRRHEGQATDERDGANRIVKVTVNSFARHLGVNEETFRRWVRSALSTTPTYYPSEEPDVRAGVRARSMVRNEPDAVVDAIVEAPKERRDEIVAGLIAADDDIANTADQALDDRHEKRRAALPNPKARERGKNQRFLDAVSAARGASRKLKDFADAVAGGDWTEEERAAFTLQVDQLTAALDMVRSGINTGSWDDELENLLAGGN